MVRMQAITRYRHNGQLLQTGEHFEVATPAEAEDLVAVGFARRAVVAAVEQPPAGSAPGSPETGHYARRDMRPKE